MPDIAFRYDAVKDKERHIDQLFDQIEGENRGEEDAE